MATSDLTREKDVPLYLRRRAKIEKAAQKKVSAASELFRLNGQSILLVGHSDDVDAAREMALQLAAADGYEIHALIDRRLKETRKQFKRLTALVCRRLEENPDLQPWTGDRQFFYDSNAARGDALSPDAREELARVIRLAPYTGIFIGIESAGPPSVYQGVRTVQGTHDRVQYGWGDFRWRSFVLGMDKEETGT